MVCHQAHIPEDFMQFWENWCNRLKNVTALNWKSIYGFRYKEEIYGEVNGSLEQVGQRSCGCLSLEAFQDRVEWGFGQPDLVKGVSACGRRDGLGDLWRSLSTHAFLWLSSETLIKILWELTEHVWELPKLLNVFLGLKPSFYETVLRLFLFAQWFSLLLALRHVIL